MGVNDEDFHEHIRAIAVPTIPATNPVAAKTFFPRHHHKLLTSPCHKTQHPVVHRFARKRDEKGMR
jgi:hypothetical protein